MTNDIEAVRKEGQTQIDTLIVQALERAAHADFLAKEASTVGEKNARRGERDAWKEVAQVYSMLGRWIFAEAT